MLIWKLRVRGFCNQMLNYEDKKWNELDGGYGVPYNPVSALLDLERNNNPEDAWSELWQELHHQGDIGVASYAAVPHLVKIHSQTTALGWNFYSFVSTIEIERHRKSNPSIPLWLQTSYFDAWKKIADLALIDLKITTDALSIRAILGTLAIAKGLLQFGALISYFDESEITECMEEYLEWSELYN